MAIWNYLKSFASGWISLMSGIASVVLIFVGIAQPEHSNKSIWIASGVCFVVASYIVWRNENIRAIKAENPPLNTEIVKEVEQTMAALTDAIQLNMIMELAKGKRITNHQTLIETDRPNLLHDLSRRVTFIQLGNDGRYEIIQSYLLPVQRWLEREISKNL